MTVSAGPSEKQVVTNIATQKRQKKNTMSDISLIDDYVNKVEKLVRWENASWNYFSKGKDDQQQSWQVSGLLKREKSKCLKSIQYIWID